MRTSRRLTHVLLALFALVMMSAAALAADPGLVYPPTSEVSDQKQGSVLIYNVYTSGATSGNSQNTRINITNTSTSSGAAVHLFFISDGCSIADSFICLTATQTATFLASDVDPGVTGYIVAIATDANGCPLAFNWLIGDLYVKFTSGHAANLGAEAFAALFFGSSAACDATSSLAGIIFDGVVGGPGSYNRVPRVLADSNVPSRADGNDTLIIINRIAGNLGIGAATLGTLFGIFYDDSESPLSFSINGGCQLRGSLSDTFPRLTPRFTNFIPAGRSGWFKVYKSDSDLGILGAAINYNPNAGTQANAFNGGHNLHKLTLSATNAYTIPVFPASCF
ncbi:MAG: hypothetical protein ABI977_09125, partial [Acidobacteriota bacterium]